MKDFFEEKLLSLCFWELYQAFIKISLRILKDSLDTQRSNENKDIFYKEWGYSHFHSILPAEISKEVLWQKEKIMTGLVGQFYSENILEFFIISSFMGFFKFISRKKFSSWFRKSHKKLNKFENKESKLIKNSIESRTVKFNED